MAIVTNTIRLVVAACVAIIVTSCTMDGFIFNPESLSSYTLSTEVIREEHRDAVTLPSGNETLYGFYCRQPDSLRVEPHPVIIYHHGNAQHLQRYWPRVEYLYQCGFDVFVYDYRGYGLSTGRSEDESTLQADAMAAYNYVTQRSDVDTSQIYHYGFSLGGVPALWLAASRHRAAGVILEAVFASGEALIQSGTILNIPGGYLLRDGYRNIDRIAQINTKLLMLHGDHDTFLPFAQHGRPLFDAARNPKTLIMSKGADHEDVPTFLGITNYQRFITAFVRGS